MTLAEIESWVDRVFSEKARAAWEHPDAAVLSDALQEAGEDALAWYFSPATVGQSMPDLATVSLGSSWRRFSIHVGAQ